MHFKRFFAPILLFCLLLHAGCVSHPARIQKVKSKITVTREAVTDLDGEVNGKDRLLFLKERGRARQMQGRFRESAQDYEAAMAHYNRLDDRAVVSAGAIAAQGAAVVGNDLSIPYAGGGFERLMLYQLDAFNRLALGDWEAVGIDIRNAAACLETELRRREDMIEAFRRETQEKNMEETVRENIQVWQEASTPLTRALENALQNSYAYYFAGLYYELEGDWSNALIAYRRALELSPHNPVIRADILRALEKTGKLSNDAQVAGHKRVIPQGYGEVVLFLEDDFIIQKSTFDFPIILPGMVARVSVPYYSAESCDPSVRPTPMNILLNDRVVESTIPLCDFRALAAKEHEERLAGILLRQTLRVAVKGGVQFAANRVADQVDNIYISLGIRVAAAIYALSSEQADLRSWLLLPRYAQVARFPLPVGENQVVLQHGTQRHSLLVDVPARGAGIIHCVAVPGYIRANVVTINK